VAECIAGARGELGESAAVAKSALSEREWMSGTLKWRYYACESFCDTGAWLYGGVTNHGSFRLARKWRGARAAWFGSIAQLRV
jgi:hypothetical protein